MAVVQTAWRKSYEQIVDYMVVNPSLAIQLGLAHYPANGKLQTISQGQYWERRAQLGVLPFFRLSAHGFTRFLLGDTGPRP